MYSIYEEITEQLETAVKNAISRAISEGELPEAEIPKIMFERPRRSLWRFIHKPGYANGKTDENGAAEFGSGYCEAH